MREVSNRTFDTLLRHLPRVLGAVRGAGEKELGNSARLVGQCLRRMERTAGRKRKQP